MKINIPEKNCITCSHFDWWDGDFCCTKLMKILQNAPDAKFNDDIIMALRLNKNCSDHVQDEKPLYEEQFKKFLNNYNES